MTNGAPMRAVTLLSGATTTGAGASVQCILEKGVPNNTVAQAIVSGTATVVLEGSFDDTTWYQIASYTASGGGQVHVAPYMRANCTSTSGGTVTLKILVD